MSLRPGTCSLPSPFCTAKKHRSSKRADGAFTTTPFPESAYQSGPLSDSKSIHLPTREATNAQITMQTGGNTTKVDAALVSLRARALDLFARLSELRDSACMLRDGVGAGRSATWILFLNKFDTLSKLFSQLTDELDRALTDAGLQSFVALPKQNMEDPAQLPDLLRTKLDPDVEREFQELEKNAMAEREGKVPVQSRIEAYNEVVEAALDQLQELRDLLNRPRPQEQPTPSVSKAAEVVLAAVVNGTGVKR